MRVKYHEHLIFTSDGGVLVGCMGEILPEPMAIIGAIVGGVQGGIARASDIEQEGDNGGDQVVQV